MVSIIVHTSIDKEWGLIELRQRTDYRVDSTVRTTAVFPATSRRGRTDAFLLALASASVEIL